MNKFKIIIGIGIDINNKIYSKKVPVDLWSSGDNDLTSICQNVYTSSISSLFKSVANNVAQASTEGLHNIECKLVIECGAELLITDCNLYIQVYNDNTGVVEDVETDAGLRRKIVAIFKSAVNAMVTADAD